MCGAVTPYSGVPLTTAEILLLPKPKEILNAISKQAMV
jgi:hypothetical protein